LLLTLLEFVLQGVRIVSVEGPILDRVNLTSIVFFDLLLLVELRFVILGPSLYGFSFFILLGAFLRDIGAYRRRLLVFSFSRFVFPPLGVLIFLRFLEFQSRIYFLLIFFLKNLLFTFFLSRDGVSLVSWLAFILAVRLTEFFKLLRLVFFKIVASPV